MHNFSGIIYRIWGTCGIIFLLGVICILFKKPWTNSFTLQKYKIELIIIAVAVGLSSFYISRILCPNTSSYTGIFIESKRDSRVAPPIPVTYKYVFWNGTEKKQVFYLDYFSKKVIYPYEFQEGETYVVHFDTLTKIITNIESTSVPE